MSSYRILHVVDQLVPASGVASVIMLLVSGIPEFTHDVAVYGACDKLMEYDVISKGGNVYKLPDVTQRLGIPFSKAFSALLKKVPYKIIHGHLLNSAFIYQREAKKQNVPGRIIHAHSAVGADTLLKRIRNNILTKGALRWGNIYVAVSKEAARHAFGNRYEDVQILGNGIDISRFKYNPDTRKQMRHELGIGNNVMCVGHVARFAGLKNHQFVLDVFRVMQQHSDCVLLLLGEGQLENSIKDMVRISGLSDSVKFLGVRRDVDKLYQAFDVLLLPSLAEGFGIVAVEAQCAGLGCIVSEHVPKVVRCSEHINFLPLSDKAKWAKMALKLSQIPRLDGSVNVKMAGLDIETMCSKFQHLYKTILGDMPCQTLEDATSNLSFQSSSQYSMGETTSKKL